MNRRLQREISLLVVLLGLAIVLVSSVRRHLTEAHRQISNRRDVYFLPPPEQVLTLSLGYKHALADVLWAHVLVSQGLHTMEQRRFENLIRLYDVINLLDPTWRSPYLLADALITFQAAHTPYEEVVKTREILERGIENRPFDGEIWLNLGQFVSFIAPASYLEDRPDVAERWRMEGTAYLARAAELGASHSNISWQALGGAVILEKAGQRDAAIRFLQRTYAVTDDQELRDDIRMRLARLLRDREQDAHQQRDEGLTKAYLDELPFIGRNTANLLGPPPHPAACAGADAGEIYCATTWREWARRFDLAGAAP